MSRPADWIEPELTCPHIDAAIASGELSEAVKAELATIREINSQLRYGTWFLKAQLEEQRAAMKRIAVPPLDMWEAMDAAAIRSKGGVA